MSLAWFQSDNVGGISAELWQAMAAADSGEMAPYGADHLTASLEARFSEVFEKECIVAPVTTGVAAKALALSLVTAPFEAAVAHAKAHIVTSEDGAFEFFTQGGRLITLGGEQGKITASDLAACLLKIDSRREGALRVRALTLTQATEYGTVYSVDQIRALGEVAKRHGLRMHVDGARLANAVASLGCRPADVTWRAGVDLVSFGATKNGAAMADAIIIFDRALASDLDRRRRRCGQSISKMRYIAAQLHAYLQDDLWLRQASTANATARRLAQGLSALPGMGIVYPVEANMVFVRLGDAAQASLAKSGIELRLSRHRDGNVYRLVTSLTTTEAMIDELLDRCGAALAARRPD
jgi:threonine aldolase